MFLLTGMVIASRAPAQETDILGQLTNAHRLQRQASRRSEHPAKHLLAILVGTTDDPAIGKAAAVNLDRISHMLSDSFDNTECKIEVLRDSNATGEQTIGAIKRLSNSNVSQSLLVYISAHGGMNNAGKHQLQLKQGCLPRDD